MNKHDHKQNMHTIMYTVDSKCFGPIFNFTRKFNEWGWFGDRFKHTIKSKMTNMKDTVAEPIETLSFMVQDQWERNEYNKNKIVRYRSL